jgi:hypothetical protein
VAMETVLELQKLEVAKQDPFYAPSTTSSIFLCCNVDEDDD